VIAAPVVAADTVSVDGIEIGDGYRPVIGSTVAVRVDGVGAAPPTCHDPRRDRS